MTTTFAHIPRWHLFAACAGQSEAFSPMEGEPDTDTAKGICSVCPVREVCLTTALTEEAGDTQWARVGIRGGLTPRERAALTGNRAAKGTPLESYDYAEADQLLRAGTMSDTQIGDRCGIPRSTISLRRTKLGIPTRLQRTTRQSVFDAHARPVDGGHVEWGRMPASGRPQVAVQGVYYTIPRLAFILGHGREPDGHVKANCGHHGCIAWQHLTDKAIRAAARVAA
ncbi:WhiB family transcriptional regulator [Streptomyces lavendulae]|uniref:WhiB family transcriptional regulator n=1 Tax=Streptomyces lavendulae TaxID=1914 RepID=UPI0033BFDE08